MNGSVAFLAVKRDMDFIVEADLDAVCFRVIHCKKYLNHKLLLSRDNISLSVCTEKPWNALSSPPHKTRMQHLLHRIPYPRDFHTLKMLSKR